MLSADEIASISRTIKRVRIPASDMEAAERIETPARARTEASRKFAVIGAAVLEKMCRVGGLRVVGRRTTPYIVDTPSGKTAISVMVSTISGSPATKHMIVPLTSLKTPGQASRHVFVAAFMRKSGAAKKIAGGVETMLAGWMDAADLKPSSDSSRVASSLSILAVPVSRLHPMSELGKSLGTKKENQ